MSHPEHITSQQAVSFSWRRLKALCIKETKQIVRDPSSALIAVVIPLMLLFIFGYGINLDSSKLRLGILMEQQSEDARELVHVFTGSPYIDATISDNRQLLIKKMQENQIRGIIVIPVNFDAQLARADGHAPIQVITDGSEPNTANFVQGYTKGIWQIWLQQRGQNRGVATTPLIDTQIRYWFNPAAISQHFLIPGAVSIIMTVVGAILTSLVVAREWERGTMEALLSTQVTRTELLLAKLLPYQMLGSFVMVLCMLFTVFVLGVPYRGSLWILALVSSLYLATALGMGLLISTLTRNQFNAAMISLNAAFLPAIMLSGFVFEIDSMPVLIQASTYVIPARYFVSSLQTLFLAGNIGTVLMTNLLLLIASSIVFIGLTAWKTRRHLE
ncbi:MULTISPECIES: ABC transporter permease [Xenorhabdus]|uniref:ABC-2 type transport system permease protein n=1 Tax=Xenorhabdus ehlersii TaxID=290111 RepID=A0A2D0ITQ9_9GAMM|nr:MULTISPECIES: ABC transporter permease [Xenorhabdus]MBC8947820.1 membrane protein [Xenorhabdus sp. TS4]MBC8948778.1 membrane protein [Xenorhabdus sp. TS4]PHM25294.1 membrane protein [Xenorhabdus ehlersii]PHM26871.1 membrane protein [Xenorhabdus ehlersii]RKE90425.1 ABC-2 type transport system permease protein [Xenorhabdus ehlersii]